MRKIDESMPSTRQLSHRSKQETPNLASTINSPASHQSQSQIMTKAAQKIRFNRKSSQNLQTMESVKMKIEEEPCSSTQPDEVPGQVSKAVEFLLNSPRCGWLDDKAIKIEARRVSSPTPVSETETSIPNAKTDLVRTKMEVKSKSKEVTRRNSRKSSFYMVP